MSPDEVKEERNETRNENAGRRSATRTPDLQSGEHATSAAVAPVGGGINFAGVIILSTRLILAVALLLFGWYLIMRRRGTPPPGSGLFDFMHLKSGGLIPALSTTTFSDIAGVASAKTELQEVVVRCNASIGCSALLRLLIPSRRRTF
jgi:ATP-dependent Zn protease